MRIATTLVALVPVLLAPPAAAVLAQSPTTADGEQREAVRTAHRLAEALRDEAALPGLAIAVADRNGMVFSEAFGVASLESREPATPLTRWRIGSISKSLTAAGAVLLAERGLLDLDATVAELLPAGWEGRPAGGATVRELAGHLGGIRHYREGEGISHVHYERVADALELFADDSLVAPPGAAYRYSTYGYVLLSALMSAAVDAPYLDLMRDRVFRPLGMRHTGPDLANRVVPQRASFYEIRDGRVVPAPFTDNSYKWGGGGLLSTPEDLARFGTGLLDGRLVSAAGVELLFTSQRAADGEETGYGMGFRPRSDARGRPVVHHGGSSEGGRAFLLLYPEEGLTVALAANRATAPLFEEEAESFAHFFLEHAPGGEGAIDGELRGAWSADGSLDDMPVRGRLRLHGGAARGTLEWSETHAPIRIVVVDRHGEELLLFGVGPHGAMTARLEPDPGGWSGRWEYLGRAGELRLRERLPPAGATCSPGDTGLGPDATATELARAERVLAELRTRVRFSNRSLPPMALADRMTRYRVPGLAVSVIDGGRVAWTCVAGVKRAGDPDPVTRETLFHVKSVAKPVSALASLRLVESGELALDEPLSARLRSYGIPENEHTRERAPTLRHLLSHSAGFTRGGVDSYAPGEPLPTLAESLDGRPPARVEALDVTFTPGTRSRYSGGGYGVLQALLEDVTGRPFPDLVDSLVFRPVGMVHSSFPQPLPEALEPFSADGHDADGKVLPGGHETLPIMAAGGLWSTAPDLARFVLGVQDAWRGEGDAPLGRSLAREMLTPQSGEWGLGFTVWTADDRSPAFRHGGSGDGFKAVVVGLPREGAGAVVLINGDGGGPLRDELLRAIAHEYDWPAYRESVAYEIVELHERTLRRLEGTYVWTSGLPTEVSFRDGALHERFNEGAWVRLFPLSTEEFVSLQNVRYRFRCGADGEACELELTDETGTYTARRR